MQIDAGVDAVQIFDSLGGLLAGDAFRGRVGQLDRTDRRRAEKQPCPSSCFPRASTVIGSRWWTPARNVLGIDWTVRLADVRATIAGTRWRAGQS